jgi:hypothetical protein
MWRTQHRAKPADIVPLPVEQTPDEDAAELASIGKADTQQGV